MEKASIYKTVYFLVHIIYSYRRANWWLEFYISELVKLTILSKWTFRTISEHILIINMLKPSVITIPISHSLLNVKVLPQTRFSLSFFYLFYLSFSATYSFSVYRKFICLYSNLSLSPSISFVIHKVVSLKHVLPKKSLSISFFGTCPPSRPYTKSTLTISVVRHINSCCRCRSKTTALDVKTITNTKREIYGRSIKAGHTWKSRTTSCRTERRCHFEGISWRIQTMLSRLRRAT